MKRKREWKPTTGVEILRAKMLSREERIQGQIAFQDGPTGLGVLVGEYDDGTFCTHVVNAWLCVIAHPTEGIPEYQVSQNDYDAIPMYAPLKLMAREKNKPNVHLQKVLELLCAVANDMATEIDPLRARVNPNYARLVNKYWRGDLMFKHPPRVYISHVVAPFGAMVFYRAFHFNVSCDKVKVVKHLDVLPFKQSSEADSVLKRVYDVRSAKAIGMHPGRSNQCDIENEYYARNGLPEMPKDPLSETVLGKKSWDSFLAGNPAYPTELQKDTRFEKHRKLLHERGYVVIHPEEVWKDDPRLSSYRRLTKEALGEFEAFFNYALFERIGRPERLHFDKPDDPLWTILRGHKECENLMGNKHFLNLATKDSDGKWTHAPMARGGTGYVTKNSGMGHATNFVRGYYALCLSTHPFVVTAFQKLYDHLAIHYCCDRWRVKCGVGESDADIIPRYNIMPIHIDTKPISSCTMRKQIISFE